MVCEMYSEKHVRSIAWGRGGGGGREGGLRMRQDMLEVHIWFMKCILKSIYNVKSEVGGGNVRGVLGSVLARNL